jgi:formylmethanofuran dehydrogenase subunit E
MMRGMQKSPVGATREENVVVTQPGVYERDGVIYVVKHTQDKQRLYAKRIRELESTRITEAGTIVEIEFDYAPGAVYRLRPEDKMPLERAKEYTIRYGRCLVCGRTLKKAESVERGIGPVCIKSFS